MLGDCWGLVDVVSFVWVCMLLGMMFVYLLVVVAWLLSC